MVSTGEPGDGGELDLVVVCDLFIENRRRFEGAVSINALSEETSLEWSKVNPRSGLFWDELDRRKMLDIVRLKLEVEPRVGRLDNGVGGGSWSAADSAAVEGLIAVVAFGVRSDFAGETEGVGAVSTRRGFGVVCT